MLLFFLIDDTDSVQSPAAPDSHLDLPEWLVCGESVILRQSNYSGIIAFIGSTEFAPGLWIGVELDAPLGEFAKVKRLVESSNTFLNVLSSCRTFASSFNLQKGQKFAWFLFKVQG